MKFDKKKVDGYKYRLRIPKEIYHIGVIVFEYDPSDYRKCETCVIDVRCLPNKITYELLMKTYISKKDFDLLRKKHGIKANRRRGAIGL